MDVHQPVHDPGLQVPLVSVHDELLPGVDNLHEGEVTLVLLLHGLVNVLVVVNPLEEVIKSLLAVHVLVIRSMYFHIQNVGLNTILIKRWRIKRTGRTNLNELLIVTDTLKKKTFEAILFDQVIDPLPPGSGRVCCVKDGDFPFLSQKLE